MLWLIEDSMKLVIDEKLKHRLIGVAVVLSLGAIFLPAVMKKSSQRLENNFSVNVQLPPKPKTPNVVMTDEKELFKTIKVANIKMPPVVEQKKADIAKEDFIQSIQTTKDRAVSVAKKPETKQSVAKSSFELALNNATKNEIHKQTKTVIAKPLSHMEKANIQAMKKVVSVKENIRNSLPKQNIYAVQLASFSKLTNAQALVGKLHSKGYKASFIKTSGRLGAIYKVYAGHSPVKSDVIKLKTQLASAIQLDGFVVNTGVS
jgi:DedD protein